MRNDPIQLCFLFASPLTLKTPQGTYVRDLDAINFQAEFEQIKHNIDGLGIEFKYRYLVATQQNLKRALQDNPVGLHFSGHGFNNKESLYGDDKKSWVNNREKGDVLMFERPDGSSDYFYEEDLKKVFQQISNFIKRSADQPSMHEDMPMFNFESETAPHPQWTTQTRKAWRRLFRRLSRTEITPSIASTGCVLAVVYNLCFA